MSKLTPTVFVILSAIIIFFAITGEYGYLHLKNLEKEKIALEKKNRELNSEIVKLKSEIYSLENNDYSLEKVAREELGLAKENEIVYVFPNQQ